MSKNATRPVVSTLAYLQLLVNAGCNNTTEMFEISDLCTMRVLPLDINKMYR